MTSILNSESSRVIAKSNIYEDIPSEKRTAREFFLESQNYALDKFVEQSSIIFKRTGELFGRRYQEETQAQVESADHDFRIMHNQNVKEFEAYCILKRKVEHKEEVVENLAAKFCNDNIKKNVFKGWLQQSKGVQRRRRMEEEAEKYYRKRMLRTVLKSWNRETMETIKLKIKNDVMRKTEVELNKVQREYETLIAQMEKVLKNKLIELSKEDEEHKLLHNKYEAMYSRSKKN